MTIRFTSGNWFIQNAYPRLRLVPDWTRTDTAQCRAGWRAMRTRTEIWRTYIAQAKVMPLFTLAIQEECTPKIIDAATTVALAAVLPRLHLARHFFKIRKGTPL
jgi:hypothetical protein